MNITFPVVISNAVDEDIIPYLLKVIERNFAISYSPIVIEMIRHKLEDELKDVDLRDLGKDRPKSVNLHELEYYVDTDIILKENLGFKIKITKDKSNEFNMTQPYNMIFTVETETTSHDISVSFKAVSIVTAQAYDLFKQDAEMARDTIYKIAHKILSTGLAKKLYGWYLENIKKEKLSPELLKLKSIILPNEYENTIVLSTSELDMFTATTFFNDAIHAGWFNLWLDDAVHKRLFSWTVDSKDYASILSYDLIYKSILGLLPETVDKAKERNTSLFNRKLPVNNVTKMISKEVAEKLSGI